MYHHKVEPNLEQIIAIAREAKISIKDLHFIHEETSNELCAIGINIDGSEESLAYFNYLLSKDNLVQESAA